MKKVLLVHISPELPSFVKRDIDILSTRFDVETFFYSGRRDVPRLVRRVLSNDLTYSWFSWDNAAWAVKLSRLFGKKSVTVVGGFDVARVPEINYGNLLNLSSARRTRYAINRADTVIAVSRSTQEEAVRFSGRSEIEVVYHGFDSEEFFPDGEKEDLVLSVGDVNASNMKRKGIVAFVETAKTLPTVSFLLVGRIHENIRETLEEEKPDNLQLLGRVSDSELLRFMQKSKVYVQVSAHEGFGCSLAEAMLCECVPVVTSRGALPEVVGDTGLHVRFGDRQATADAVEKALKRNSMGRKARERIRKCFPLEKRRRAILERVEDLL